MHVAIVAPEFPPEIGGMQTYALEFAQELLRRGHRVTVLTRMRPTPPPVLPGLKVRQVLAGRAGPDLAAMRHVGAEAWHVMNAAYAWVALHFAPTVVSIHGNDFLCPYILVGEPDLGFVPGLWRLPGLRRTLERRLGAGRTPRLMRSGLGRAVRILANSRYTERVFLERFPECSGRTSAAMVGVSGSYLEPATRPVNAVPELLTVCRLSERRKNVDLVLRALALLKNRREFRYTIVGDGELRPELESLTVELGLGERVRFAGFLDAAGLRAQLLRSDLFVLTASINPASHEGFGIVYLEANACGTPTLAARLAGAAEAVADGVSGTFVDVLEVGQVAAALDRVLSGEQRFESEACRAFARGFGWDRVVDAALPWYVPDAQRRAA